MLDQLRKFLDLPEFVRHVGTRLPLVIGDAERPQPRPICRDEMMFGPIMGLGDGGRPIGHLLCQTITPLGFALELYGLSVREEMGIEKIPAD